MKFQEKNDMKKMKYFLLALIISLITFYCFALELDKGIYQQRRAELMKEIDSGIAIIPSGYPPFRNGDVYYSFRVDNNFFYLTGIKEPGAFLVLYPKSQMKKEMLFLPSQNPGRERWEGKSLKPGKEAQELTGIETILSVDEFERITSRLLRVVDNLYYISPAEIVKKNEPLTPQLHFINQLKERYPHLIIKDLSATVAAMRLIKSPEELKLMQQAIDITGAAQREAMKSVEPGMYEYEIKAVIEYVYQKRGTKGWGFPSIVGSGPNSCILHYEKCTRKMEAGDMVVMDIGAEYENYSADITRTIPVSGKFAPRQRAIYNIVLEANKRAIAAVKPGRTIKDIDKVARDYIISRGYGEYFIHGTSHWLGMNVHDVGDHNAKFEPGMVITVEPGIYMAEENLGIRIEDDILITEGGHKVLSSSAPKEIAEIEKLMKEKGIGNIAIE
jgi:Xaa-Pro aminopeptidase